MTDNDTQKFPMVSLPQTRGYQMNFPGRLVADTEFRTRDGLNMVVQLWEAEDGTLTALTGGRPPNGRFSDVRIQVFGLGDDDPKQPWIIFAPTEEARQWHVMQFFGWDQRAMKMARKRLGWSFVREFGRKRPD